MANIDKNPRQITRLRVEDQNKLERIAGDSEFLNKSLPHRLTTALEIVSERGFGLENSDATFWMSNDSNDITIGSNADGELVIDNGFDTYHLPYDSNPDREGITANLVTSDKLKTLFGNQSMYGSGNIDLYVYTLKLSVSFGGGMGYIYIDYQTSDNNNNVEVNSVTKFTTLTKATEGSIISCICSKGTGDGVTVIGNNIRYENGVWYVYCNDSKYQYSYQGQVSNATITNCSQLKKRTI